MVAVKLPFVGLDVTTQQQIQGMNANIPQHQHQQPPPPQPNPWIHDQGDGLIEVTCCNDDSPYHKLICGHLIHTQSKGCGRTCRIAVNSIEKLCTEFCCDWCADEETFNKTMEEIRIFWSAMILNDRILLLDHLQPYIDGFEDSLKRGRRARIGRRGRKAFARPDKELVENLQIQVEGLIERSCRYFLKEIMKKKGRNMYDEPDDGRDREDGEDGNEDLSKEHLDEAEEGEVEDYETEEEESERETISIPDLTAALSLRPRPQFGSGVEHKLSFVESLVGLVDLGDSFRSVEEAVEAEEERTSAQTPSPVKRTRDDDVGVGDESGAEMCIKKTRT
jgi:hypothetical protein